LTRSTRGSLPQGPSKGCGSAQTERSASSTLRIALLSAAEFGGNRKYDKEWNMSLGTILLVVLILMLVGVLPVWPHASSWGYGPSGIVGVILVVILVLFLMGRL
jgi:hypothetical protein